MPRSGINGTYTLPGPQKTQVPNTPILSSVNNQGYADIEQTFNTPQPIAYGGTGEATAVAGTDALSTKGTDIASATTTDIGAATGRFVHITGTTTITGLGTKTAGVVRFLTFDGILTLTHNATSLILPGATNIVTAAGDAATAVSEGGGNWRIVSYQRASGQSLVSGISNGPTNLGMVSTVAANALSVSIKGFDGADPSPTNPVYIPFRSATANSGDVDVLTLSAATSFVISSGSTLGMTNAVAANLIVVGFNDAGTFRLGLINSPASAVSDGIASSTAEGGAGAADNLNTFYTSTAVTNKPYTVLGFITSTQATAGSWASTPTLVQVGSASPVVFAQPLLKKYTSPQQTITAGGTLTLAHGLGVMPTMYTFSIICLTAEWGYVAGQEAPLTGWFYTVNATQHIGVGAAVDGTNINIKYGLSGVLVLSQTGGNAQVATPANWRLIVRAFA